MFGSNPSAFHSTVRAPPLFAEKSSRYELNLGILPPPPYSVAVSSLDNSVNYLRRNVVDLKIATSPEHHLNVTDSLVLSGKSVSSKADDSEADVEIDDDQPLDLSMKRPVSSQTLDGTLPNSASTSGVPLIRPTVIRNSAYARKNVEMKRSASSVTSRSSTESDVSEHFRRSLSGKWPRRQASKFSPGPSTIRPHFTPTSSTVLDTQALCSSPSLRPSTAQTPPSQSREGALSSPPSESLSTTVRPKTGRSSCTMTRIIINNGEIDDHFRKALGEENFKLWRSKKGRDE
uniref:Flocculation protein FLO11-like n=1 Tax=Steinernema glaseri TaxID=37863 RepID=A0A1I8AHD2_9BILA